MTADQPPELHRLRSLHGEKWTKYGPDVVPAWVADMDLPPAPMAIAAVQGLVDRGDFGYNHGSRRKLANAFAGWQADAHGWRPDPTKVRVFCDVLHAVETAILHTTDRGDGVVIFTPSYPPFMASVSDAGRRVVACPLDPDGWRLTAEALAECIDETTKVILLCNPHNPTGRVFDGNELAIVAEVAAANDLLVLSDEVWADIVHEPSAGAHIPFATLGADRVVVASSASKSFNLAGLRCAVAFVDDEPTADALAALPSHALGAVSSPGADATLACWTEGRKWLDSTVAHLTRQRDHLAARLGAEAPQVDWQLPDATYLAWLDLRGAGLGPDPAGVLLERAELAVSSGPNFGPGGSGFIRVNLATTEAVLDLIIDRLVLGLAAGDA